MGRRMELIDSLLGRVSRLLNTFGVSLLFVIMLLVSANVILRYGFSMPITGTFELVEILLGVAIFSGFAYTARINGHIQADFFADMLPPGLQRVIDIITTTLSLAVFIFMTYALWEVATDEGAHLEVSARLGISLQPFMIFAALGIGLMCLELLRQLVRLFLGLSTTSETEEKSV